jgi:hypothetical protein
MMIVEYGAHLRSVVESTTSEGHGQGQESLGEHARVVYYHGTYRTDLPAHHMATTNLCYTYICKPWQPFTSLNIVAGYVEMTHVRQNDSKVVCIL